ncbi:outer membrane beta-barrel protein [Dysgonomonas sp.]
MKISFFILFLIISTCSYAQSYSVKGIITNESNQQVEAVTCILRNVEDSIPVKTIITDKPGEFSFTNLPNGSYKLILQHMAYEKLEQIIKVENNDIEIPPFVLTSLSKELNEVVVSAERPVVKAEEGKLIYDVPMLIKNKVVSNAFESLQNVPSVIGSGDDIQLIGSSGFTILINGQLTSMTKEQLISFLKTIPASRVANIEIMYSAPPQYNIRGAAINVVLKDQEAGAPTLMGEGNAEYNQAHYASYKMRGNLVYTKPSFNADLTIGIGESKGWGESHMYAKHLFDSHVYDITQNNKSLSDSKDLNTRLGLGYTFKNKDKITFAYTGNYEDVDSNPESKTVFLQDQNPYTAITSKSNKKGNRYLHNAKVEYNSHKEFKAGIDYTFFNDPATEKYYDSNGSVAQTSFKTSTEQRINSLKLFANHAITVSKEWKLSYGGNFSYSKNNNRYDYYKNPENVIVDSINNTKQKEQSASIFAGLSKTFGKLSAQASISGNYFRASIDIMGKEKTLWNDFQPFVNANITYMHNPKRILQLSFSSDINYPPYWALSSDIFKINAYSSAQGNPELKFSRVYKTQLNFIMNQKYVLGGYYEYNPDHYIQLPYQSQDKLENMFQMVNLDYSKQYGIFFVAPFKVKNIWDASANIVLIRQEQKDDNFYDVPYKKSINSFVLQLRNTVNISSKPNIKLDASGFYMNGAIQGIYDIKKMWNVTGGLKWTFLDNKAELMAQIQEILRSGARTKIDYMNQYNTMNIKANSPVFRLSFTYRFGNYKKQKVDEIDTSRYGR